MNKGAVLGEVVNKGALFGFRKEGGEHGRRYWGEAVNEGAVFGGGGEQRGAIPISGGG